MLQGDVDRAFEARSRRVQLLDRGDLGGAGSVLRLDFGDFEARYDAPDAAPTVVVSLRANLARPGGAPIASHTFTVRQPAEQNRIGPIAAAYDKAVIDALNQVVDWTDANAPAAPTPTPALTMTTQTQQTSETAISKPR
jgi:cholesterol transport system auxiliary component